MVSSEAVSLTALFSTFCCRNRSFFVANAFWSFLSCLYEGLSILSEDFFVGSNKTASRATALLSLSSNYFSECSPMTFIFICIVRRFLPSAIVNISLYHCIYDSLSTIRVKSVTTGYAFDFFGARRRKS